MKRNNQQYSSENSQAT